MRFLYRQITGVDPGDFDIVLRDEQYSDAEARDLGLVLDGVYSSDDKLYTVEQIEKWKKSRK